MHRRTIASLLVLLGTSGGLEAQTLTTLAPYVAADQGVNGLPVLLGVTVGRESPYVGFRWSTAVDATSTFRQPDEPTADELTGLFTSEVDLLLFPLKSRSTFSFTPYAFAGAGMRMTRDAYGTSPIALWSYGLGVRRPVGSRLSLDFEARKRSPITADMESMPYGTQPGWEGRVGVTLRIGRLGDGDAVRPAGAVPFTMTAEALAELRRGAATAPASEAARYEVAAAAIGFGTEFLGTRYTWGGNTPQEGFDCSGFIRYVYARQGISLPRVSRDQARVGAAVPLELSALQPGDIIAFASDGQTVDHVAIYAGNNLILHSSSSGRGVRYDDLTSPRGGWYMRHMVAARRVIGNV